MANKRWFDDWKLGIGQASGGGAFVDMELPHATADLQTTRIFASTREAKRLANVLDKLLCELTGTTETKLVK